MYDATSESNEFIAETRDEAITKATRFYGVDQAELEIREPPAGSIFGLGARAVVVAIPKSASGPRRDHSSDRGDRGRDRGDRGRGRGRGQRERSGARESGGRGSSRKPDRGDAEAAPREASQEPSKGTAVGTLGAAGEYLLGIVERMGLGPFELRETEEGEFVVLELKGQAADRIASDDSRTAGGLQLLVNQAAQQDDDSAKRVVVDCGGDTQERESFIERQAERAARRAVDTGRAVALDPMNGGDRRALHMAVRPIDGVVTMSVGSGRYRQVVIVPEGAPEYEEAEKAAREAEARDSAGDRVD
jgi:spoIIIJ-associated protein